VEVAVPAREAMAQHEGHPSVQTSQLRLEAGEQQTSAEPEVEVSLAAVVLVQHDQASRSVLAPVVGEGRLLFSGPGVPEVSEVSEVPRWSRGLADGLRRGAEEAAALSR
jgi:hypothetical protein